MTFNLIVHTVAVHYNFSMFSIWKTQTTKSDAEVELEHFHNGTFACETYGLLVQAHLDNLNVRICLVCFLI